MARRANNVNASRKVRRIHGDYLAKGLRFGVVVSEFNEALTNRLLDGCVDELVRHGARAQDIVVVRVPGAFEIPLVAQELIKRHKDLRAVITLAVVIKGQTRHFDQVVSETARGIRELGSRSRIPVILGMIPAASILDVEERTGIKHRNKGRDWALAAIEMANLLKKL